MRCLFLIFFIFAGCGDEVTMVDSKANCEHSSEINGVDRYVCEESGGVLEVGKYADFCDPAIFAVRDDGTCIYYYDEKGLGDNRCESNCEFDCSELKTYSRISGRCTKQFCTDEEWCYQGCIIRESLRGYTYLDCAK